MTDNDVVNREVKEDAEMKKTLLDRIRDLFRKIWSKIRPFPQFSVFAQELKEVGETLDTMGFEMGCNREALEDVIKQLEELEKSIDSKISQKEATENEIIDFCMNGKPHTGLSKIALDKETTAYIFFDYERFYPYIMDEAEAMKHTDEFMRLYFAKEDENGKISSFEAGEVDKCIKVSDLQFIQETKFHIFDASKPEEIKEYVKAFMDKNLVLSTEEEQKLHDKLKTAVHEIEAEITDEQEKTEAPVKETARDSKKRIYLDVPFKEKDEAKSLGARWDRNEKSWYVTKDAWKFKKWTPEAKDEKDEKGDEEYER